MNPRLERNVLVPMSDGVELAADLYLPSSAGSHPALICYYPYRKDDVIGGACEYARRYFTEHGYASLLVDARGTGGSDGVFPENFDTKEEGRDGAEVVEWVASQPWCDGAVGMYGLSYGGIIAMATAAQRPPHLRAIAPMYGPPDIWRDWIAPGGCANCLGNYAREVFMLALDLAPPTHQDEDGRWRRVWEQRVQRLRDGDVHMLRWLEHRHYDDYWQRRAIDLSTVEVPTYFIGSWQDLFPTAVPLSFEQVSAPKRLLMGPWLHIPPDFSSYEPVEWLDGLLSWWDRWLRDEQNGVEDEPPVTIFVQGSAEWRREREWPPAASTELVLSPAADGTLRSEPGEPAEQLYKADPTVGICAGLSDPLGTGLGYPADQTEDDLRSLTYTSDLLSDNVELTGTPVAQVSLVLDRGRELHLVAKLEAISPDGYSTLVSTGWLDAECRNGLASPEPLEPGGRYELRVPMSTTSFLAPKASRLRLAISCSDFPRVWPTGENPVVRLLLGEGTGTALHLPVVGTDRGASPARLSPVGPADNRTPWNAAASPFWHARRDEAGDRATVEFGTSALMSPPSGSTLSLQHRTTASVDRAAPECAQIETDVTLDIRLPGGEKAAVNTHGRFTKDVLLLEGSVRLDEDLIFAGRWDRPSIDCVARRPMDLIEGGPMILIDDLGLPEGPVLLPDGSWLVTELAPARGCITRFDGDGGNRRMVAYTGRPNGLALDDAGTVWVAESMQRSLIAMTLEGEQETVATESEGERFHWPNDVCVGPDGAIYMTDSGVLITDFLDEGQIVDHCRQLGLNGRVCRFDPTSGSTTTLDAGILFPNGIAFGPDGLLYVNETMSGDVFRYDLANGARVGGRELFGNVLGPRSEGDGVCGPDGMAFDVDGNLYVTVFGQSDVTVLDQKGEVVRRLATEGASPTNVAFGPRGSGRIFVVENEHGRMEVLDVGVDGLPLPGGAP